MRWIYSVSAERVIGSGADEVDATGICAVAGSGFGQEKGSWHLRVTALCPGVEEYVGKIEKFHKNFLQKWE